MSLITHYYAKNSQQTDTLVLSMHGFFINSYLTNRKQFVQCNGVNSNERTVTHGVPKGSILGPTLFCIHINGVVSTTPESSVFLYADDTETHQSSPTLETGLLKINSNLKDILLCLFVYRKLARHM